MIVYNIPQLKQAGILIGWRHKSSQTIWTDNESESIIKNNHDSKCTSLQASFFLAAFLTSLAGRIFPNEPLKILPFFVFTSPRPIIKVEKF